MVDAPANPAAEQKVALIYSKEQGDEMVGTIKKVDERQNLSMVLWPDNPIEDWVENASLKWNAAGNRWEIQPEG